MKSMPNCVLYLKTCTIYNGEQCRIVPKDKAVSWEEIMQELAQELIYIKDLYGRSLLSSTPKFKMAF